MTISRTLYTFTFLVKFSDVNYFCIKCKYHISRILLRIATKRARITPQILLTTKSMVFTLKILLLASKPTGHLVPRCRNNFQLWCFLTNYLHLLSCLKKYWKCSYQSLFSSFIVNLVHLKNLTSENFCFRYFLTMGCPMWGSQNSDSNLLFIALPTCTEEIRYKSSTLG